MDIINNIFSLNKDNDIKNPNIITHNDEYYKKYIKYKLKYLDLVEQIGGKGKSGKGRKGKSRRNSKKRSHKKKSHKKKKSNKKKHQKKKKHHDEESSDGDSDYGSDNTDHSEDHEDNEEEHTPHHQMHRQQMHRQQMQPQIHHPQYSSETPDEYSGSSHYMSPQHVIYQQPQYIQQPQDSMNEITPDDDSRQQLKSKLTEHAHKVKGHIQNIHGYLKEKFQQQPNNDIEPEHLDQDHLDNIDEYENY